MKRLMIVGILAASALMSACSSQQFDDSKITAKIESKLVADSETSALKIKVETNAAVVTLSGTVPTETEKSKAETLAKDTDGVKRVVNQIKVDQSSASSTGIRDKAGEAAKEVGEKISDATILTKVKAKLLADGIKGTNVDVTNGSVVLKGLVEDMSEKAKAGDIAKNVSGVKDVTNQLTVRRSKST
jgi:osmotically-inducible protein OsmY